MIENLMKVWALASEWDKSQGKGWYQAARLECQALADELSLELARVIWAVAATSPMLKWEKNVAAVRAIAGGRVKVGGVFSSNIEKALHILEDEPGRWETWLSGDKVTSFAANISGDGETVTIDTWAWRAWACPEDFAAKPPGLQGRLYAQVAADYKAAAAEVGLPPREFQAVLWVTLRRLAAGKSVSFGQLTLPM